jgi:uncharacterized protein (TIGR02001 family)
LITINIFGTDTADISVRNSSTPPFNLTIKERIMKKSKLLNSLILAGLAVPGLAMAEEKSPFSGNVSLVSDYLYRGISQTGGGPAIQGGFDYAHPSGFYIGAWGSNVSWLSDAGTNSGSTGIAPNTVVAPDIANASLELDTYLGFKNSFAGDFSYDLGYLRYNYPGTYASGITKADTDEIYGLIGWKWITLKYSYSLGDTFGISDAGGTSYIDLSASYTIEGPGVTLGAHYGDQSYKGSTADTMKTNGMDPSYTDWKVSVSKDFSGYVVGLYYSDTNVEKGGWYTNPQNKDLGKGTAVLSLSHAM